jgi:hypothetical protein
MPENLNLENAVLESAINADLTDLTAELSEKFLGGFLNGDSPLKDVPVFGLPIKILRCRDHISNYFFSKKILSFLLHTKDISDEEKQKFNEEMEREPKYKAKVAEELLFKLERLDAIEKAPLLAKAFSLLVKDVLHFEGFQEITMAIDRSFLRDLAYLKNGNINNRLTDSTIAVRLSSCGLMEIQAVPGIPAPGAKNRYKLTELGESFRDLIL